MRASPSWPPSSAASWHAGLARDPTGGGRIDRLCRDAILLLLKAYKLVLSPWFAGACRHWPSCSTYAAEAVATHGSARGAWLAAKRLARCHPLGTSGYDPVPPARAEQSPDRASR